MTFDTFYKLVNYYGSKGRQFDIVIGKIQLSYMLWIFYFYIHQKVNSDLKYLPLQNLAERGCNSKKERQCVKLHACKLHLVQGQIWSLPSLPPLPPLTPLL
jgi:hypothetical protein